MPNCGWKEFKWRKSDAYLGVASRIGGAAQSACCLCSQNESASHMTRTGEGGFCCSGLGSLGGGKPTDNDRNRKRVKWGVVNHQYSTGRTGWLETTWEKHTPERFKMVMQIHSDPWSDTHLLV